MDDYISREAARPDAFCDGVSCQECPFLKDPVKGGCKVDDFLTALPAADVRPVVLCRDCRHSRLLHDGFLYCTTFEAWNIQKDFFCAFGERFREGGTS